MKTKRKVCGTLAGLSFMYLLGVAGNSDLGLEPSFGRLALKTLIGLAVLAASLYIGGYIK